MLLFSNVLIFISFGLSYAWVLSRIIRQGRAAPIHAPNKDVLILGKALNSGEVDPEFQVRLERGAQLIHRHGAQRLIVLGGRTEPKGPSEAGAGRRMLLSLEVPDESIVLEESSRHTLENLRNARDLLGTDYQERLGLVSSRYHLARSRSMARGLGMEVDIIAAEPDSGTAGPGTLLVETYLYHWFLVGHFMAHRTNDRASIDRIS